MVRFSLSFFASALCVCLLGAALMLPAVAQADDLDDVLDDLVQYQEQRRAAATAAANEEETFREQINVARADEAIAANHESNIPVKMQRANAKKLRPAARREYKRASLRSM